MKQQIVVLIGFLLMMFMIFPLISIFDQYHLSLKIPAQALYVFGIWAIAILAIALVIIRKKVKR